MSFLATMFKLTASRNDRRRDAAIALPQGVKEYRDISYGRPTHRMVMGGTTMGNWAA